jgi:hypothetical protein
MKPLIISEKKYFYHSVFALVASISSSLFTVQIYRGGDPSLQYLQNLFASGRLDQVLLLPHGIWSFIQYPSSIVGLKGILLSYALAFLIKLSLLLKLYYSVRGETFSWLTLLSVAFFGFWLNFNSSVLILGLLLFLFPPRKTAIPYLGLLASFAFAIRLFPAIPLFALWFFHLVFSNNARVALAELFSIVVLTLTWLGLSIGFLALPNYLISQFYLLGGNAALATYPNNWEFGLALAWMVFLIYLFVFVKTSSKLKLGILTLVFLCFKYAITRQGIPHIHPLILCLLVLFVFFKNNSSKHSLILPTLSFILFWFSFHYSNKYILPPLNFAFIPQEEIRPRVGLSDYKLSNTTVAAIAQEKVDSYPWDFNYQHFNSLRVQPKPIPQIQIASNHLLDSINCSFLNTEKAAPWIIWHNAALGSRNKSKFMELDRHYLLNISPLTTDALMRLYEPLSVDEDGTTVLKKKSTHVNVDLDKAKKIIPLRLNWNEKIPIPALDQKGYSRLKFNIKSKAIENLKAAIWKPDPLYITYFFNETDSARFRLNQQQTLDGIWLTPFVVHPTKKGRKVEYIRISCPNLNAFYPLAIGEIVPFYSRWEFI